MSEFQKWTWYTEPPIICRVCVGKVFQHRENGISVKVHSVSLLVDHILRDKNIDVTLGDVPALSTSLISFEILDGVYVGQNLTMTIGIFLGTFSLVSDK
jgi:hypothetical protein